MKGNLPGFIIIGAMKAGTTSLYEYLNLHPEIGMSRIKETNYFLGGREYSKGPEWYKSLFEKEGAKIFGEASPNYTKQHRFADVPRKMASLIPDAKLIYVVRDPVERAISHYTHNIAKRREKRDVQHALQPDSIYIKTSSYHYQIFPFLDYFSLRNILIVDSFELMHDTESVLLKIFGFLNVSEDVSMYHTIKFYHQTSEMRMLPLIEHWVKSHRIRKALNPLVPAFLTKSDYVNKPLIYNELVEKIKTWLREDVAAFRHLSGRDFPHWSI